MSHGDGLFSRLEQCLWQAVIICELKQEVISTHKSISGIGFRRWITRVGVLLSRFARDCLAPSARLPLDHVTAVCRLNERSHHSEAGNLILGRCSLSKDSGPEGQSLCKGPSFCRWSVWEEQDSIPTVPSAASRLSFPRRGLAFVQILLNFWTQVHYTALRRLCACLTLR